MIQSAARTHPGRRRTVNEDRWLAGDGIYAVADGVGGGPAGEVAATLAIDDLRGAAMPPDVDDLAERVRQANRRIHELGEQDPARAGMATTLTAAMVGEGRIAVAHVGDSRAYRLRDGRLDRLTDDHSFGGDLVRRGLLDGTAAAASPFRGLLTRSLGALPDVEVDSSTHPTRLGDLYLLCTDGLTGPVGDERIAQVLRSHPELGWIAGRLVECALRAGGPDNVTVVLFRVSPGAPPAPRRAAA